MKQFQQLQVSESKRASELFNNTIKLLEKYIEIIGYHPDRERREQIKDKKIEEFEIHQNNRHYFEPYHQQRMQELEEMNQPLEEKKIDDFVNSPEDIEEQLTTILLNLYNEFSDKPYYLREEIKKQYHHWVKEKGIDIDNCPSQLKKFLFGLNEVLEGNKLIFREIQQTMFNNERGKIQQTSNSAVTNSQIILDIKNNPQNWRIEEGQCWSLSEILLVHKTAQIIYDQEGNLDFHNNPVYRANRFNQIEINEIIEALNNWRLKNELVEQQNHLASLIKQRKETKDKILGDIEEVIRFKTWWSNHNVATVVNHHNGCYQVFVVVYEPSQNDGKIKEVLETFEINNGYDKNSLDSAKFKAANLRTELNGENPILYIHPNANSCTFFSSIVKEPYIIKVDLPYETETRIRALSLSPDRDCRRETSLFGNFVEVTERVPNKNPENYLKPLDIVKVGREALGNKFYHFGIYLGNNKVCHYSDPNSKVKTDNNQARITNWEIFVRECVDGEIIGYHPVIPFKHYQEIAKNIAWDEANNYGNLRYCLANHNCEHYVNSRIFGLNYSKLVEERPIKALENSHGFTSRYGNCGKCENRIVNSGESGNFCLRDRLLNQNLNKVDNYHCQEVKRQYLQEVPAKDNNCQIM